ncbi:MAG: glutamine synthetase family protein [Proteobacteria bacterium]|nr:glutamine synthetase family protein [Pseudomonadota bacterium]
MGQLSANEIIQELKERGSRRIKLGITDTDGVLRGKYLALDKFESVAASSAGFCDCIFGWDVDDQLYDNGRFSSWDKGFPDTPYRIDLDTIRTLPYEDNVAFFLAELVPPEGDEFHPICPRNVLSRVVKKAVESGFTPTMAFEYEFFLFDENPHSVREKGYRNLKSFTPGNFGYSVLRNSVHSDLHEDLLDFCEAMEMPLEGYHTETGPGVMEAALQRADRIEGADRAVLFKTFSKVYFQRQDLMPTFMAKWSPDYPGQSGHLHLSLADPAGESSFFDRGGIATMSKTMEHFVAGMVTYMREVCAMVAPTINSYTRLVKGAWAPTTATWGVDNRTCAVRVIPGTPGSQRVEYRLAGAEGNPYLVAAAALASGLAGIEEKLELIPPVKGNAYQVEESVPPERQLPATLRQATAAFTASELSRNSFGDEFVEHYAATRDWETREFERAITDWELARYFEII